MLSNMFKREIAEATLYGDMDFLLFKFSEFEEAKEVHQATLLMKSTLGFMVNVIYDELMEFSKGSYNEFMTLLFTEIEDEYFKLMVLQLYLKIPIEEELNKYVLMMIDKIMGE